MSTSATPPPATLATNHTASATSSSNNVLYRRKKAARRSEKRRISEEGLGVWTKVEHNRFLEGKRLYPNGPWKLVAEYVGTRNTRQTMTHAQKYRQKLERRQRGLRTTRKISEDEQMLTPELYYTSSPRVGRFSPSAAAASPKGVDMAKIKIMDISAVAPQVTDYEDLPPATALSSAGTDRFGSFEQLLLDNTICMDAADSLESYAPELLPTTTTNKLSSEACSPTHHADTDLPWLDECLDFFIHNLP